MADVAADGFEGASPADLTDAAVALHAARAAVTLGLFRVIAEVSRTETWRQDGSHGIEAWVAMLLDEPFATAAEWVRVALALEDLPVTAAAYGDGRVSEGQLRHLATLGLRATESAEVAATVAGWARIALGCVEPPAAIDDQLVALADGYNSTQLAHMARLTKPPTTPDADDEHSRRYHSMFLDPRTGVLTYRGRVAGDGALIVHNALMHAAGQTGKGPDGTFDPLKQRLVDSLVGFSARDLVTTDVFARQTVVVHADADILAGADGIAEAAGGILLASETLRRMACDCDLTVLPVGPAGTPVIGVGRTKRLAPSWLANLVRQRDHGCRLCGRQWFTQVHHVDGWQAEKLGRTDMPRLAELCWSCHHLVHEGRWAITGDADALLTFTPPGGRPHLSRPAAPRPRPRGRSPGRNIELPYLPPPETPLDQS